MPQFVLPANQALRISASSAENLDGASQHLLRIGLARLAAKSILVGTTALTDNSTGVASGTKTLTKPPVAVGGVASGSNLAIKANTEASLVSVVNALSTILASANSVATKLGLTTGLITDNTGGVNGSNTIAAITTAATGATTGCPVVAFNATVASINTVTYNVAQLINQIGIATGATTATALDVRIFAGVGGRMSHGWASGAATNVPIVWTDTDLSTLPALVTNTGVAASPAVLATEATTILTQLAANVATLAAGYTKAIAGYLVVPVVVVP